MLASVQGWGLVHWDASLQQDRASELQHRTHIQHSDHKEVQGRRYTSRVYAFTSVNRSKWSRSNTRSHLDFVFRNLPFFTTVSPCSMLLKHAREHHWYSSIREHRYLTVVYESIEHSFSGINVPLSCRLSRRSVRACAVARCWWARCAHCGFESDSPHRLTSPQWLDWGLHCRLKKQQIPSVSAKHLH